jgi:hypothetical protein
LIVIENPSIVREKQRLLMLLAPEVSDEVDDEQSLLREKDGMAAARGRRKGRMVV